MRTLFFITTIFFFTITSFAQQFVDKAVIEFEVNTNLKKAMGNNSWEEQMKEEFSDLKTSFYLFTFSDNKSVFKFDRWSPKTRIPNYIKQKDEENSWYFDFNSGLFNMQKNIIGTDFVVNDSIPRIDWKITNENREIAGYNCRKAVGKIFGDVYVFAFYTDEITISGGPVSISGLPGMILGLTIPRLYTSYVATKVDLTVQDTKIIKPAEAKKTYDMKGLKSLLEESTKDWFTYGEDKEELKNKKNMFMWNSFL